MIGGFEEILTLSVWWRETVRNAKKKFVKVYICV